MAATKSWQVLSIGVGTFAAGASYSLGFYGVPTILVADAPSVQVRQFSTLWRQGLRTLPPAFVAVGLVHLGLAFARRSRLEAVAGLLSIAIVPFSIFFIRPTEEPLLLAARGVGAGSGSTKNAQDAEKIDDDAIARHVGGAEQIEPLMHRFVRLNYVRGSMPLLGAAVSLYGMVTGQS